MMIMRGQGTLVIKEGEIICALIISICVINPSLDNALLPRVKKLGQRFDCVTELGLLVLVLFQLVDRAERLEKLASPVNMLVGAHWAFICIDACVIHDLDKLYNLEGQELAHFQN